MGHDSGYEEDAVHYQLTSEQPIEVMQELFTAEQYIGFLHGNIIKYAMRLGHKGDRLKDAEKLEQYTSWLSSVLRELEASEQL